MLAGSTGKHIASAGRLGSGPALGPQGSGGTWGAPDMANTPRVLLVEDNAANAYLARYVLEAAGFEVDWAANGQLGLEAAAARRPDIILMDLRMPVLDGYEATRRLKADPALRDVPVLAMSAQAMPEERARALAAGCAAHIGKPIDVATLADEIRPWLP
ncbi:response regulator [Pelomonas sp. Root1217]|uniref:response regulator n=1 Tax=Pelomonas sp. Root1217 TaxID=1736430 RepID=UPI000B1A3DAE|nr:response regulator [Pelomonas sp. Root1217]